MKRKLPHPVKIYEALGSISDSRIEIQTKSDSLFGDFDKNIYAKLYSSSRGKFYEVKYNESSNSIMANDNGSYWQSYLGYPSIALLLLIGKLPWNEIYSNALKGIKWKDINTKNKNNFDKTILDIDEIVISKGISINDFKEYIIQIETIIEKLDLNFLGEKVLPPSGY